MCNAFNHSYDCQCGFGGEDYVQKIKHPEFYSKNKNILQYFNPQANLTNPKKDSLVIPNAKCPICGERVYFYRSPNDGRVYFDELGPPWPKHPCTITEKQHTEIEVPKSIPKLLKESVNLNSAYTLYNIEKYWPTLHGPGMIILSSTESHQKIRCILNVKMEKLHNSIITLKPLKNGTSYHLSYAEISEDLTINFQNIITNNIPERFIYDGTNRSIRIGRFCRNENISFSYFMDLMFKDLGFTKSKIKSTDRIPEKLADFLTFYIFSIER